ncbi:hypothetical protein U9M48_002808 [Paspalum notatum var. saurae]|uniref:BED-type domain-containing protein n=1 Tax=Paspalum notatum var. saurae TaxID=547442 RepID=A0AAQ3SK56_PASNO
MASASGSVCASTGASPAASHGTLVGTGQSQVSAPKPPRPTAGNETARVDGDGGPANVIHLNDVEESLEPAAKKKRDKKTTSEVWDYFTKSTVQTKGDKGNIEMEVWAKCKKCTFKTRGESNRGTTVFWNHLKNKHNLVRGQQELHLQSAGNSTVVQNFKFDPEESLKKFYKAVIMHDYPFKMVDHEFFVDFIKSLRPHFAFKCRITTRNDIIKIYLDEKKMLFDQLKLLSCRFSATMDMWTSNQNKGYMCITIHWIDDNWGMQKRIICLPHVKGRHGGELLAHEFVKGVMDWHLEKRLFSLTLDNAAANNKCVREVVKELNNLAKIRKSPPLICGGVFFHIYKERAPAEVSRFMDVVMQLFQAYLKSALESTQSVAPPEPIAANTLGVNSDIEEFLYKDEDAANRDELSELDVYMKQKIFRWVDPSGKGAQFDVLSWWKSNQVKFPVLSRLARDVLAVQVSTVASNLLSALVGAFLDPEAVEALVCTKDWLLASSKDQKVSIGSILDELDDTACTSTHEEQENLAEDADKDNDEDNEIDSDIDDMEMDI